MGCCGGNSKDDENIEMNSKGEGGKSGKYGAARKYDPSFNGPIKNRGCTDIICCILFVLYIVGMLIVGVLAFVWGDPMKLINPTDSKGRVCGKDAEVIKKPYLFYFDLTECIPSTLDASVAVSTITNCPTYTVCVAKCPSENTVAITTTDKNKLICKDDYVPGKWDTMSLSEKKEQIFTNKSCAPYTLQSSNVVSRCIPTVVGETLSSFLSSNQENFSLDGSKNITKTDVEKGNIAAAVLLNLQNLGKKIIQDVQQSWYWILAGLGISMAASFLYILIMRWVAGILVWLTTYAVLTLIGYGVYYCYNEYDRLKNLDANKSLNLQFSTNLSSYKDKKETWLAFTIILAVTLGILLLLLLALRSRIRIAIQIIKEASKSISRMISTLFFPILPWIFQVILFAWFVAILAYLVTAGDASFKRVENGTVTTALCKASDALKTFDQNVSCNFIEYKTNDNLLRMQIFHLFGWFWLMNFIIAFGQCALAGAFASWYWAWDKKTDVPTLPLLASVGRTLRYHTGSLAFGSLIIAIIQLIRAGLEYLDHKLNGPGSNPGPVTKFLIKCLKCLFWCFEKFIKFLNKNAYIEIAVYGKNFCTSAKNAFMLLMRNVVRVVVLDKVTDFLLFIGKLTVVMAIAVGSFYWFKDNKDLNYYLAPVMIISVGAYMIVSAFFSVYEMAIDTIFLCFLEDSERHDGSPEKPYYMSKALKRILGKKNKKSDDDDD